MKRLLGGLLGATLLGATLGALSLAAQEPRTTSAPRMAVSHSSDRAGLTVSAQTALVKEYCSVCHNDRIKAGGMTLVPFDAAKVVGHAALTEKMIRKLRA